MKRWTNPEQNNLFDQGGGSIVEMHPFQPGQGGSTPTPPLQFRPKQLRIEPIENAARIWLTKHYLKRDVPGLSLTLGVFAPGRELVGAVGFSEWVPFAPAGGRPNSWELRRLWLDDRCQKNSESRVIRVALAIVKSLAPQVTKVIAYADLGHGHKGTIYRASGFVFDGETEVNTSNSYGSTKNIQRTIKRRYVVVL